MHVRFIFLLRAYFWLYIYFHGNAFTRYCFARFQYFFLYTFFLVMSQ